MGAVQQSAGNFEFLVFMRHCCSVGKVRNGSLGRYTAVRHQVPLANPFKSFIYIWVLYQVVFSIGLTVAGNGLALRLGNEMPVSMKRTGLGLERGNCWTGKR